MSILFHSLEWGKEYSMPKRYTIECLFPECKLQEKSRGLCAKHYQYTYLLVKQEKVSWDELVAEGRALPAYSGGKWNAPEVLAFRKWLGVK